MNRKDLAEVCAASRHDRPEDRVVCLLEPHIPNAWGFICGRCWETMLNARARRMEWETDGTSSEAVAN